MENNNFKLLKDRIKQLAKKQGKGLNDIQKFWGLSLPGLDKRIKSDNFPYSKAINELADYLNCTVADILEIQKPEYKLEYKPEVLNEVNEMIQSYYSESMNLDDKTALHVVKSENQLLRQFIQKLERELEFLRTLLMNGK